MKTLKPICQSRIRWNDLIPSLSELYISEGYFYIRHFLNGKWENNLLHDYFKLRFGIKSDAEIIYLNGNTLDPRPENLAIVISE